MLRRSRLVPLVILTLTWVIQAVRVTHGVDFNDEMQYYGELVGLVANGRLFATDLYIQQGVYLLVYPLFKPIMALIGWSSIIVVARAVLACFILWIFRQVRRSLESTGVSPVAASTTALGCTFAVPFMNIYAISYNSVGLGILALCFAEFFAWRADGRPVRITFWVAAVMVSLVAHPPLALSIGTVLLARLWLDRDFSTMRRLVGALCVMGTLTAAVAYRLVTMSELRAAIALSRAISVGTVLRTGLPWFLGVVSLAITLFVLTQRRVPALANRLDLRLAPMAALAMGLLCAFAVRLAILPYTWAAAFCCVFAGLVLTVWPGLEQAPRRAWTTVLFIATGAVMALSSSNGFRQIQGPAMVAAPFYFAIAVSEHVRPRTLRSHRLAGWTFGVGLIAVYTTLFLATPYHDERIWHLSTRMDEAPAFRGLFIAPAKTTAIREVRRILSDIPQGSRLMVLGAQPWIYVATSTYPDTDMGFMHPFGLPKAYDLIAERLRSRHPDYVVIAAQVPDAILRAFDEEVKSGAFICEQRPIGPALEQVRERLQTFSPLSPQIVVCRRANRTTGQ